MVELRVCDVKEFPFGWRCPSVPGTRVIAPLDASKVLSLLSVNCPLDHPVQPQALRRPADGARDGCAASNPAITAHGVVLSQALLLGGTCGLPGHDEVAECDVHCPVSLQFACDEILCAACLQSHTALCRGGGSEDCFNVLVRTFEHLDLFDVILDPLDWVPIDVIAGVDLLLADQPRPDHHV